MMKKEFSAESLVDTPRFFVNSIFLTFFPVYYFQVMPERRRRVHLKKGIRRTE
jgi:hypothetical protein